MFVRWNPLSFTAESTHLQVFLVSHYGCFTSSFILLIYKILDYHLKYHLYFLRLIFHEITFVMFVKYGCDTVMVYLGR